MTSVEWVKNTKTGTVAQVVTRYVNTFNKKPMVQVKPISQMKDAYWLEKHVVAFHG